MEVEEVFTRDRKTLARKDWSPVKKTPANQAKYNPDRRWDIQRRKHGAVKIGSCVRLKKWVTPTGPWHC